MKFDRLLSLWVVFIVLFGAGCVSQPMKVEAPAKPVTPIINLTELMQEIPVILFPTGNTRLTNKARQQVRYIAELINQPGVIKLRIYVNGHSDTLGDANKNMMLSRKRADSVSRELILNGVRSSRITNIAKGESEPLIAELSSDGSQDKEASSLNRRVEIQFGGLKTDEVQP